MATKAAIGGAVVVRVAVARIGSCRIAAPTIVIGAHSDCRPDQRDSNQSRGRRILVSHHFRTLIELHVPAAEFFGEVLLECWILALQVSAT